MSIITRITKRGWSDEDQGITVRETLNLIKNSEYYSELIEVFDIESIKDEFIEIPGAKTLVSTILQIENSVHKIDVQKPLKNIRCKGFTEEGQAILEIAEVEDPLLLKTFKTDLIEAETTYSVRSDYFNGLYEIDKYVSFLLKRHYDDILKKNIEMLEEKNKDVDNEIQIRLILDEERKLFARALTSVSQYKDYNISFSVFVTLIQLHNLYKQNEESFEVKSFSITDSDIKVIFRNNKTYEFLDKSRISFSLELTNDEIKREAVQLKGQFSIEFGNDKDVVLMPEEGTSKILTFKHSLNPITVKRKLSELNGSINDFIKDTIDDFQFVKNIKKPDQIREYLYYKTEKAREKEFISYKGEILRLLSNRVSTLFQLLDLVNSVNSVFKDEDIKAQDFWSYKLYQALIEEPKKK